MPFGAVLPPLAVTLYSGSHVVGCHRALPHGKGSPRRSCRRCRRCRRWFSCRRSAWGCVSGVESDLGVPAPFNVDIVRALILSGADVNRGTVRDERNRSMTAIDFHDSEYWLAPPPPADPCVPCALSALLWRWWRWSDGAGRPWVYQCGRRGVVGPSAQAARARNEVAVEAALEVVLYQRRADGVRPAPLNLNCCTTQRVVGSDFGWGAGDWFSDTCRSTWTRNVVPFEGVDCVASLLVSEVRQQSVGQLRWAWIEGVAQCAYWLCVSSN